MPMAKSSPKRKSKAAFQPSYASLGQSRISLAKCGPQLRLHSLDQTRSSSRAALKPNQSRVSCEKHQNFVRVAPELQNARVVPDVRETVSKHRRVKSSC